MVLSVVSRPSRERLIGRATDLRTCLMCVRGWVWKVGWRVVWEVMGWYGMSKMTFVRKVSKDLVGGCGCWRRWTRAEALFSTSHVHDYLGLCMSSGTCRGFAYATSRLIGFLSGKSGIAFWVHCIVTTPSGPFQIPILS